MEHISTLIRVPIEKDNPSIKRLDNKCIQCGHCASVCSKFQSVLNNYDLASTGGKAVCVNCGQCAIECPVNCIVEQKEYDIVRKEILNKDKVVVVSTAPSVRVSLGEMFGVSHDAFVEGKLVSLLKKLGFNYVLDVNFSADLTIMEEANELIERINGNAAMPQFTSCCPAWVKFVETFYPNMRNNLSSCKSPISMHGATLKTYWAEKMGIDPNKIVHVALTPCTAKKMEIKREELNSSGIYHNNPNMRDTDYVITTREIVEWVTEEKIDVKDLADAHFDEFMGEASCAGVIFGKSGGVMQAALRTAYKMLTGNNPPEKLYTLEKYKNNDAIRVANVAINGINLRLCVVYGLANARVVMNEINNGEKFHFVEVMTCPNGCIGGGGQIKYSQSNKVLKEKQKALEIRDENLSNKVSCDNTQIINLYNDFYKSQGSKLAQQLLHTKYFDRSTILNAGKQKKFVKYMCKTCGATFEVEEGKESTCPMCLADGDDLQAI